MNVHEGPEDRRGWAADQVVDQTSHRAREATSDRLITLASQRFPNVLVVDPASLLCQERCRSALPGLLVYSDDNHLTARATRRFEAELEPTLP